MKDLVHCLSDLMEKEIVVKCDASEELEIKRVKVLRIVGDFLKVEIKNNPRECFIHFNSIKYFEVVNGN